MTTITSKTLDLSNVECAALIKAHPKWALQSTLLDTPQWERLFPEGTVVPGFPAPFSNTPYHFTKLSDIPFLPDTVTFHVTTQKVYILGQLALSNPLTGPEINYGSRLFVLDCETRAFSEVEFYDVLPSSRAIEFHYSLSGSMLIEFSIEHPTATTILGCIGPGHTSTLDLKKPASTCDLSPSGDKVMLVYEDSVVIHQVPFSHKKPPVTIPVRVIYALWVGNDQIRLIDEENNLLILTSS